MKVPSRRKPADHQEDAGHHGRQQHAVDAMTIDGRGHQHDEGAGRPADLEAAAAQRRNQEAADDGRVEPAFRRRARGDGDRHGQRQRHDRDREARHGVGAEGRQAIAFAQHRHELRHVELGEARPLDQRCRGCFDCQLTKRLCGICFYHARPAAVTQKPPVRERSPCALRISWKPPTVRLMISATGSTSWIRPTVWPASASEASMSPPK